VSCLSGALTLLTNVAQNHTPREGPETPPVAPHAGRGSRFSALLRRGCIVALSQFGKWPYPNLGKCDQQPSGKVCALRGERDIYLSFT
jgi:hypothetical protein